MWQHTLTIMASHTSPQAMFSITLAWPWWHTRMMQDVLKIVQSEYTVIDSLHKWGNHQTKLLFNSTNAVGLFSTLFSKWPSLSIYWQNKHVKGSIWLFDASKYTFQWRVLGSTFLEKEVCSFMKMSAILNQTTWKLINSNWPAFGFLNSMDQCSRWTLQASCRVSLILFTNISKDCSNLCGEHCMSDIYLPDSFHCSYFFGSSKLETHRECMCDLPFNCGCDT